jgi:hypothetical protein
MSKEEVICSLKYFNIIQKLNKKWCKKGQLNRQHSMPTGFFIWGYMYPFTFIFGGTSKFLGVQSLTLHLGVQRKLTAFSPHKVVHHAVFCKYYTELAKTFFLSDIGSDRKWGSVWSMVFVSVPPFFFVMLYITCQILFFIQNWMQDYLYIVMIIKQLN